ncbi:MAG: hypothetical protein ACD_20C00362G0004 [uncultured bacterium]|nr:MAG: hypothetical protein ACD_20C00362G0004 [uncultured bacterium]
MIKEKNKPTTFEELMDRLFSPDQPKIKDIHENKIRKEVSDVIFEGEKVKDTILYIEPLKKGLTRKFTNEAIKECKYLSKVQENEYKKIIRSEYGIELDYKQINALHGALCQYLVEFKVFFALDFILDNYGTTSTDINYLSDESKLFLPNLKYFLSQLYRCKPLRAVVPLNISREKKAEELNEKVLKPLVEGYKGNYVIKRGNNKKTISLGVLTSGLAYEVDKAHEEIIQLKARYKNWNGRKDSWINSLPEYQRALGEISCQDDSAKDQAYEYVAEKSKLAVNGSTLQKYMRKAMKEYKAILEDQQRFNDCYKEILPYNQGEGDIEMD